MDHTKNTTRISGFSSPRASQQWFQDCRNPSGLLGNIFCVCVFLTLNPAVELIDFDFEPKGNVKRGIRNDVFIYFVFSILLCNSFACLIISIHFLRPNQ